jgi:hypothetical protein
MGDVCGPRDRFYVAPARLLSEGGHIRLAKLKRGCRGGSRSAKYPSVEKTSFFMNLAKSIQHPCLYMFIQISKD